MFVFLRLQAFLPIKHGSTDVLSKKKHVYAQIISDHNNYYDVLIKTLDGRLHYSDNI